MEFESQMIFVDLYVVIGTIVQPLEPIHKALCEQTLLSQSSNWFQMKPAEPQVKAIF